MKNKKGKRKNKGSKEKKKRKRQSCRKELDPFTVFYHFCVVFDTSQLSLRAFTHVESMDIYLIISLKLQSVDIFFFFWHVFR